MVFRWIGTDGDILATSLRELAVCSLVCTRWLALCDDQATFKHLSVCSTRAAHEFCKRPATAAANGGRDAWDPRGALWD